MTASQVASTTAAEEPTAILPNAAETPPVGDVDGSAPGENRRRRKVAVLLLLLGLFAALLGLILWYMTFRQPVPLPPIPVTQVPHFNTAFGDLDRPTGIAVNSAGDRIYVTQSGGQRVATLLDANGAKVQDLLPPTSTGSEHAPVYLAIDPVNAEVYVSDRPTGAIYVYDAAGSYLRQFEPIMERTGWQPMGLTFDKDGNLYVTDLGASPPVVVKFDRDGNEVATFGADDNMNFPNGVAVDANGYVYVTDSNNGRLLVYSPEGPLVAMVGRGAGAGMLGLPRGVAVDGAGHVYVMDTSGQSGSVYKQFQQGQSRLEFVGNFGSQGVANGQFMYPTGLAVDGRGRIYIADTSNNQVQVWNY